MNKYKTKNGSIVVISGKHNGIIEIDFNWIEENNACCDCEPFVENDMLIWECKYCDGGNTILIKEIRKT